MARTRYKTFKDAHTYFATNSVVNWLALFAIPRFAAIVLDSLRFIHEENRIIIHGYVLMENHLHLIGSSKDFSGEMRKFKSFTARKIVDSMAEQGPRFYLDKLKCLKRTHKTGQLYQLWQEGFHPELIVGEKMMAQKMEYIHYNPVRRGYVDKPEHWRYSSFRQYLGRDGMVPIEPLF